MNSRPGNLNTRVNPGRQAVRRQATEKNQEQDGQEQVINILLGIGLGLLLGTLLIKAAKNSVKGDVAAEFADALEAGVSS